MIKMLNRVHSVRTISFDNGNKFADYVRFSIVARDDVYFANPMQFGSQRQIGTPMEEQDASGPKNCLWRHSPTKM